MPGRRRPRQLVVRIPAAIPVAPGCVILLELDEADARALAAGAVPDHVASQCAWALTWCEIDPATGYAKGFTRA